MLCLMDRMKFIFFICDYEISFLNLALKSFLFQAGYLTSLLNIIDWFTFLFFPNKFGLKTTK